MKKIFLSIILCLFLSTCAYAENFPPIKYKNISAKTKLFYDSELDIWSSKVDKKQTDYFVKTKNDEGFYEYLDADKNLAFNTECDYEFIYNNKFVGYSNKDMNFYEIRYKDGACIKTLIPAEEVELMLPNFRIIKTSDFTKKTNSLKIKKHHEDLNIVVLKDTDCDTQGFVFTSGNAKIKTYSLTGFVTVMKQGMIQFAPDESIKDSKRWFVLLVR